MRLRGGGKHGGRRKGGWGQRGQGRQEPLGEWKRSRRQQRWRWQQWCRRQQRWRRQRWRGRKEGEDDGVGIDGQRKQGSKAKAPVRRHHIDLWFTSTVDARYQNPRWHEYLEAIGYAEYPELTWDRFLEQNYPQFRPQQGQPEPASSTEPAAARVRRHHIGAFQQDTDVLYQDPRWHEHLLLIDYAEFPELTWDRFLDTRYPSSERRRDEERKRQKCNTHYARVADFHQIQRSSDEARERQQLQQQKQQ